VYMQTIFATLKYGKIKVTEIFMFQNLQHWYSSLHQIYKELSEYINMNHRTPYWDGNTNKRCSRRRTKYQDVKNLKNTKKEEANIRGCPLIWIKR